MTKNGYPEKFFDKIVRSFLNEIFEKAPTELIAPKRVVVYSLPHIGRLLRLDIVQFHFAYLGTKIFSDLNSNTLSSNPKRSRSVDLQFFHKPLFYLQKF